MDFANGYYFFKNTNDNVGTFFPLCGRRTSSDGNLLNHPYKDPSKTSYGQDAYYLTSGYGRVEGQYQVPYFSFSQPSNLKDIPSGKTPIYSDFDACKLNVFSGIGACAVRCVRDDDNLVVNK